MKPMTLEDYSRKEYLKQKEKVELLEIASHKAFENANEITGTERSLKQNKQYREEGLRLKEKKERESKKLLKGESYYINKYKQLKIMDTKTTLEDLEKLLKAGAKEDAMTILREFQRNTLLEYGKWYKKDFVATDIDLIFHSYNIDKFIEE